MRDAESMSAHGLVEAGEARAVERYVLPPRAHRLRLLAGAALTGAAVGAIAPPGGAAVVVALAVVAGFSSMWSP